MASDELKPPDPGPGAPTLAPAGPAAAADAGQLVKQDIAATEEASAEQPSTEESSTEELSAEELSAEELRLMADTMPGDGPGD